MSWCPGDAARDVRHPARRASTQVELAQGRGAASAKKQKGPLIRLQERADRPRPKSAPGLSFLKPAPKSADVGPDQRQETRGPEPSGVDDPVVAPDERGAELVVDVRAGKGGTVDAVDELAPHPTRGKLMPPEVFTEDEVRALIAACSTRGVTGHRNRALLAVLWRTGVRISEALELRPHDVDFKNGTVRVRLGKGLKPRTTVLSDLDALPLVERWLEERGKLAAAGEGAPLFCTLKGTPTDPSYARHLLPRLAKRAGLKRRVHPHGLRHTHAADLALAGVPVLAIQQQLGHSSLVTTANYLRRVGVRLDIARMIRR